jgi:hypothetical protein
VIVVCKADEGAIGQAGYPGAPGSLIAAAPARALDLPALLHDLVDGHRAQLCPIAARGLRPGIEETQIVGPPAFPAGPVSGGKGRRLIEEEQLRIGVRLHHRTPASLEFEQTGDPMGMAPARLAKPALLVVQDAAIAHQRAASGNGFDGGKRREAILVRHGVPLNRYRNRNICR